MLLCLNGFCDACVTLYNVSVTLSPALSKKILDVHPWSDSIEFRGIGEAVMIDSPALLNKGMHGLVHWGEGAEGQDHLWKISSFCKPGKKQSLKKVL